MGNDEYIKGQEDLIKKLKVDIINLMETPKNEDFMFDLLQLLKNLKPTRKDGE